MIFLKKTAFLGLNALLLSSPSFAQDALKPASEQAQTSQIPSEAQNNNDAWKLVSMTESLVLEIASHEGDCNAMKQSLQTELKKHDEFLKKLDYSTDHADEAAITRIHDSAVKLGTLLGACYDDDELRNLLIFQTKR